MNCYMIMHNQKNNFTFSTPLSTHHCGRPQTETLTPLYTSNKNDTMLEKPLVKMYMYYNKFYTKLSLVPNCTFLKKRR